MERLTKNDIDIINDFIATYMGVGLGPDAPEDIIRKAYLSHNWRYRFLAATTPGAPSDLLDAAIDDPHGLVRWAAAGNPNTPETALDRALDRRESAVAYMVARNPAATQYLLRRVWMLFPHDLVLHLAVLEHSNAPADVLLIARWSDNSELRAAVALRPSLDEDELRQLWREGNANVRAAVVSNPACPVDLLKHASRARDAAVRLAAVERLRGRG